MHKTKLISLFKYLNSREQTRFLDYVNSPFYNKHTEVKKLCAYLVKYATDPKKQHRLEKERIFKYVYPNKLFDGNILHAIASKLLSLLHDFLVVTAHEDKRNVHLIKVLSELRHREQSKDYEAVLRKLERNQDVAYNDVEDLYWEKFLYHGELDTNFLMQGGRSYNENLQLKNDFLDLFFITKKLKLACSMISRNKILGSNYQYRLVDELFVYLNQPDSAYAQEPTIKIYAAILKMLLHGNKRDTEYFEVKSLMVKYRTIFAKIEQRDIYGYLENHCISRYQQNTSVDKYLRELLDISKFLVQHKINFIDGRLLDGDYKNIGTTAINLGDYEWAKEFIENYKDDLLPNVRESAYSYLLAFWSYSTKDYKGALQALYNVIFTNWTYHAGAKMIQLRVYYELDEGEALYSLTDAFRNYLKRNKQLTDRHRKPFYNFINSIKRLYKLKESQDYLRKEKFEKDFEKLEKHLKETSPVLSKVWLLEMMDELRPAK